MFSLEVLRMFMFWHAAYCLSQSLYERAFGYGPDLFMAYLDREVNGESSFCLLID